MVAGSPLIVCFVSVLALTAAGSEPRFRTPLLPADPEVPGAVVSAAGPSALGNPRLPSPLDPQLAKTFPFNMVGSLNFRIGQFGYVGSATLIQPQVALTAAHNLYDGNSGFSSAVRFDRGQYGGSVIRSSRAQAIYLYSATYIDEANRSPNSIAAFAFDVGWVTFKRPQAGTASAPYAADFSALKNNQTKYSVGYGAQNHSGRIPLSVSTTQGFFRTRGAFFENRGFGTEGGMSGGPVFSTIRGRLVQTAVLVSGSGRFQSGVRVIDRGLLRRLRSAE